MKKLVLIFFILSVSIFNISPAKSEELDQTNPENVVKAIFDAAKSGNYENLKKLCDPLHENDGDTRRICEVGDGKHLEEFIEYFKNGKVTGEASIKDNMASVPILFGPDGTDKETMNLIQRNGKWYLYSF